MPSSDGDGGGWGDAGPPLAPQRSSFALPLVCRQGRPTALEHMSRRSLVAFVTFLLHHSRTTDERSAAAVRQLALTWPEALNGAGANGDALSKCSPGRLRRLVRCWYRLLGCEPLLPLSTALEREANRGRLRLQRNGDGTSSLVERLSERLVVTYRDDRLYDDRPAARGSPCAPPAAPAPAAQPPPDCPHCGAQFVTLVAAMAHERLCDGLAGEPVSDDESVRSEPTARTVSQPQFLGYLGVAPTAGRQQPYQSPSAERRQRRQRRRRHWPTAELLLRLSRADFSSPLGQRLLDRAVRQPEDQLEERAARLDRHCSSRAVRAPSADFPVTWTARAPPPERVAEPRQYCFTARQRAERAASLGVGVSARCRALYSQVRPCSVLLRRLRCAHRRPPHAARVLLSRLTPAELAAWLPGRPPPTPPDRPPASGALRRHRDRQKLLRDECKTIRDERFFRLLSCAGRVTRADAERRRPRSRSEGDPLGETPAAGHRRMSLLGSMQDRLHSGERSAGPRRGQTLRESDVANITNGVTNGVNGVNGVKLSPDTSWRVSPSEKSSRASPVWPRRDSPATNDRPRRLPLAINSLMSDECKTLRDREFVKLLNRPSRTTRSGASERRRPGISVWLHWPGFAREPAHQTPVKHARAASEPRACRVPVVRLERLFRGLRSAGGGGPVRCRRRLTLDAGEAALTGRFAARCRRRLLEVGAAGGEERRPDPAPPPPPPPQPQRCPPGCDPSGTDCNERPADTVCYREQLGRPQPSPPTCDLSGADDPRLLNKRLVVSLRCPDQLGRAQSQAKRQSCPPANHLSGADCNKRLMVSLCYPDQLGRPQGRARKALSEPGTPDGLKTGGPPLDIADNNNTEIAPKPGTPEKRRRTRRSVCPIGCGC